LETLDFEFRVSCFVPRFAGLELALSIESFDVLLRTT